MPENQRENVQKKGVKVKNLNDTCKSFKKEVCFLVLFSENPTIFSPTLVISFSYFRLRWMENCLNDLSLTLNSFPSKLHDDYTLAFWCRQFMFMLTGSMNLTYEVIL